jgi:uncharacterized protein (DUF302 family)
MEQAMSQIRSSYTLSESTDDDFGDAVRRVREELAREGFGVLCEINVQATLKQKLGVDRDPYLILGACNPPLAHRALEAEPELGALLPCNVPRDQPPADSPTDPCIGRTGPMKAA